MSTRTYRLPNLPSLLQVSGKNDPGNIINPHLKEAEASFRAWMQNTLPGDYAKTVEKSDVLLFAGMLWPHYSYESLLALVMCDHLPKEEALDLARSWVELHYDDAKPARHPLVALLQGDVMRRIKSTLGVHWSRFIVDNRDCAFAIVQERQNQYLNADIESYFEERRPGAGVFLAFTVTRSSRSLDIPDDVLAHPAVQEMERAMMDVVIATNDIYSYAKEYKVDKAFANIVTIISNNEKTCDLDLQVALDRSGMLIQGRLEHFHASVRDLPSFNPEVDAYLAMYAEALVELAAMSVDWHSVSRRYKAFENEEDRKNNIVRWAL